MSDETFGRDATDDIYKALLVCCNNDAFTCKGHLHGLKFEWCNHSKVKGTTSASSMVNTMT